MRRSDIERIAARQMHTGQMQHARQQAHHPPHSEHDGAHYKELSASKLLCPKCNTATEVRERLLLVLPDGNLFDYICTICGTSTGTKKG